MRDLYLRFANADEMQMVLLDLGFQKEEEQAGLYHPDICLDVVGVMTEPKNPEEENPELIELPGYHANVRVINDQLDITALEDFTIHPETPSRVWA